MIKKSLKFLAVIILMLVILISSLTNVIAETSLYVPYESYTYWENVKGSQRKLVYNRPMYETKAVINAKDMGVTDFSEIVDICTDKNNNLYVLDSDSRIVVLDDNYKVKNEILALQGCENQKFKGAKNIYVHSDSTLYISDTENNRVIHCDENGKFIKEILLPKSPLIPENFDYRPIKTVVDNKGYVYILSEGSYYGALLYAPDMSFIGFYGANDVVNGILGAIKSLFNRMFPNNEKKSNSKRILPYTFTDIVLDGKNFVYTATDSSQKAQIRKLNPGMGNNILDSEDIDFTDEEVNRTYNNGLEFKQTITGLAINDDGFLFCLDSSYGKILVYDSECRMITAFGGGMGNGTQKGTFSTASAITIKGNDILIADKTLNTITIFKCNDYGEKVLSHVKMTIDGDYAESLSGWKEIIALDRNLQIAYVGLSRAYLADNDYAKAMDVALEGYDRETYALAFEYHRNNWISENFSWLFGVSILAIALIITVFLIMSKKKVSIIKNEEVALMFSTLIHPSNSFEYMKEKQKGSLKLSVMVLIIFYITTVIKTMFGGFMFTQYDPGTFNSFWVMVQTIGLVAIWVVANWLVTSLASGKGRIKEITIVTSYSLMPIIFGNIIWTCVSNFILPSEESFLFIILAISIIYSLILFIIGMLQIHEYTMTKFIGTSFLTVLGMMALVFLLVLVGILLQQLGGFVASLFVEIFM